MFLALVRRAGLPEPLGNLILDAPDHPRLEVDFYWPAQGLVVETDGWETHKTKAAFQSDRRKDAALTSAALRVMRFTYDDVVYEPDAVVARLASRDRRHHGPEARSRTAGGGRSTAAGHPCILSDVV